MSASKKNDLPPLWPAGVAKPAQRALAAAGYTRIENLATVSQEELGRLHGMGPKALRLLEEALADKGLSFRPGPG